MIRLRDILRRLQGVDRQAASGALGNPPGAAASDSRDRVDPTSGSDDVEGLDVPSHIDALGESAARALQRGDPASAERLFKQALAAKPDHVQTLTNLGIVLRSVNRLEDAEHVLRRAVAVAPGFGNAHANLGVVLLAQGDREAAEAEMVSAVAVDPNNVSAINNLGSLYRDSNRLDQALPLFRRAIGLQPNNVSIWQNLAAVQMALGDWESAVNSLRNATSCDEHSGAAWSSLGYALSMTGALVEAEVACRRALQVSPDWPDALVNLASVLRAQGDDAAAAEVAHRALAIQPSHAGAHLVLGTISRDSARYPDAEMHFQRAIELDPGAHGAQYNLGIIRLLHGDYVDGFARFESRFAAFPQVYQGVRAALIADTRRQWSGETLHGKRLLLWTEQGIGDAIMMFRFLPLLSGLGATAVSLACDPPIARLALTIVGVDFVAIAEEEALPEYDLHCSLMSLPHVLGISRETIPGADGYILYPQGPAPSAVSKASASTLRVGIAWAGNRALAADRKRSMQWQDLGPLLSIPSITWTSLQKGEAAAQLDRTRPNLLDPMDQCIDFLDTARVIAGLDLVISVDTAVAHLAGAMGIQTWLLNRAESEWRWGLAGERTPWYSAMRIFRQAQDFEWGPPVQAVRDQLHRINL